DPVGIFHVYYFTEEVVVLVEGDLIFSVFDRSGKGKRLQRTQLRWRRICCSFIIGCSETIVVLDCSNLPTPINRLHAIACNVELSVAANAGRAWQINVASHLCDVTTSDI